MAEMSHAYLLRRNVLTMLKLGKPLSVFNAERNKPEGKWAPNL